MHIINKIQILLLLCASQTCLAIVDLDKLQRFFDLIDMPKIWHTTGLLNLKQSYASFLKRTGKYTPEQADKKLEEIKILFSYPSIKPDLEKCLVSNLEQADVEHLINSRSNSEQGKKIFFKTLDTVDICMRILIGEKVTKLNL